MKSTLLLTGWLLLAVSLFAKPAHSLKVGDGAVNPLGFYQALPTFSWELPLGVKKQTAYRIEVTTDKSKWDSGWVISEQSTYVPYGGVPLISRERAVWRVRFRDERDHDSGWSEPASFELGLLSAKDWVAQWICPDETPNWDREPVAALRRKFSVTKKILRARAYVTARGLFELRLNGERVGHDHFANGWTSYHKRIDTLTYDVTKQLSAGENSIEALLGTGWYGGRFPFGTKSTGPYGKSPELLLQLEITYQDGSLEKITSDSSWDGTYDDQVLSSSIYDGEHFDAHPRSATWKPVHVNADLGAERLTPKPAAPVREAHNLVVRQITEPAPGRFVFDLGQNMVGWAKIKIPVVKDQPVTLRFAEMLKDDGTLYTENYRSAKSTDIYVPAATGMIEWQPHFTFHGFRYVELSGLPADVKPSKDWVRGIVLHSGMNPIGEFTSSHAKLNQLQSNIVWGQRSNFVDIPTDCPQRDERLGWTGDAQVFAPTAMFNYDCAAFWKSWLSSLRDDQYADGRIPNAIPDVMPKWQGRSPGWFEAATIIPWEVYVRTGDRAVLEESFSSMEKLVGWYRSQSVDGLLPSAKGFGDWLQPYPKAVATPEDKMLDRKGDTPLPLIGAAFYARSVQILADSARAIHRDGEARRYSLEAAAVRAAFSRYYFENDGRLKNATETQTAYVLALAFDLIPAEMRGAAASHLVRLVHEADGHLRTGFLGTPYLVSVLDKAGYQDLACELLFCETYPSWFYSINQGATTMWERWNSYTRDKGFGDVEMNSFNHYAYGAIGQWMYERLGGIAPDPENPGYKHFFVRPLFAKQLTSASTRLETPYGLAASSWQVRDGKAYVEVTVPPNATATVMLPSWDAARKLEAGKHSFAITLNSKAE